MSGWQFPASWRAQYSRGFHDGFMIGVIVQSVVTILAIAFAHALLNGHL